jgi:predicted XRE-type DNA-binding protein
MDVGRGSANVFADLRLPDPEQWLAKAELANEICALIKADGLTQHQAARKLAVDQPKVSALMRGRLKGFSSDRLLRFITLLGRDIQIRIRPPKPGRRASIRICA